MTQMIYDHDMTGYAKRSPVERSRHELSELIQLTKDRERFSTTEAKALANHLDTEGFQAVGGIAKHFAVLRGIGDRVLSRREQLSETHRFINRRKVGYSGMLAYMVGNTRFDAPIHNRAEAVNLRWVVDMAESKQVDPNVVLDAALMSDIRWLIEPTLPREHTANSDQVRKRNGL